MINLRLRAPSSIEEVNGIIKDPEIFDRVSEDGHDIDKYSSPKDKIYFIVELEGTPHNQVIGLWILYPENKSTLNIHCNILKKYRAFGKEAGKLILKWFVNECAENYKKLNAEIPVIYPEVYHYTRYFGFKDEGVNRKSIFKNGYLVDQFRLGITRQEVEKYLEGV